MRSSELQHPQPQQTARFEGRVGVGVGTVAPGRLGRLGQAGLAPGRLGQAGMAVGRLGRAGLQHHPRSDSPGGYVDSAVEPEEEEEEDEEVVEEEEEEKEQEDDEEEDEDEDEDDEEKAFQLRVFNLFMKRTVAEVKAATPGITPSEIFDECALRWGIAPENPDNNSGGGGRGVGAGAAEGPRVGAGAASVAGAGAGSAEGARVALNPCAGTQSRAAAAGPGAGAAADDGTVRGATTSGEAGDARSPHVVGVTWTVGVTWNARAGKWYGGAG